MISEVKECGYEECTCIEVDSQDHLYLANDFNLTHNTFKNSIIIADECQNMSLTQLTMLLTRLGDGSKMILNGDSQQSDLAWNKQGGLDKCIKRLAGIDGIEVVTFTKKDSVRHPLIEEMLKALED